MSTPTAKRWFLPNHAYRALHDDYAICCSLASDIQQDIHAHDFQCRHFDDICCPPRSFLGALRRISEGYHSYAFAPFHDTLVYADVDSSNPNHEKEVRAKVAAAEPLEKGSEVNEAVRVKIIKHLVDTWDEHQQVLKKDMPKGANLEAAIKGQLQQSLGSVPPALLNFIIGGLEKEERREALMLASGQARLPVEAQRPVLLLVSIVDTAQSTVVGESIGYKTAYDPLSQELITRPFHSKEGSHLLGDNWFAEIPDDGISFRGTLVEFCAKFMDFMNGVNEDELPPSEAEGFKYLVWARTIDWMIEQYRALSKADPSLGRGMTIEEFENQLNALEKRFQHVKFPIKEKKGQEKYEKQDELDYEFRGLKDAIEEREFELRCAAAAVKDKGKERKAEEAARMWERVGEAIRDFETVMREEE
ncbi:MAG: hypothetical protein Q9225_006268 [Loekoesia sp. 1 TL-2023]